VGGRPLFVDLQTTGTAVSSSLLIQLDEESDDDPILNLATFFANDHPIEVELGFGKGRFLLDAAQRRPAHNFIGVEVASKYLRLAHGRARRRELQNLRFIHGDAREFVEFFVPAESVHAVHVYFPDPWPKKKHHKRRLIDAGFLSEAWRILQPEGRLWIATDHDAYYEVILEAFESFDQHFDLIEAPWNGVTTNYEDKFVSLGSTIHRRIVAKI